MTTQPKVKTAELPEVVQLRAVLDQTVKGFSFDQQPLMETLSFFKQLFGSKLNFRVDPNLASKEILITLSLNDVTLGGILRAMLKPNRLAYVVSSDGYIYISTPEGCRLQESDMAPAANEDGAQTRTR